MLAAITVPFPSVALREARMEPVFTSQLWLIWSLHTLKCNARGTWHCLYADILLGNMCRWAGGKKEKPVAVPIEPVTPRPARRTPAVVLTVPRPQHTGVGRGVGNGKVCAPLISGQLKVC